ncbi:MAG: AAA family ATPase, partial [Zoogloeaceae bacterium]|nr:AAA family ATPase [Zoogloeaceae bacterium]
MASSRWQSAYYATSYTNWEQGNEKSKPESPVHVMGIPAVLCRRQSVDALRYNPSHDLSRAHAMTRKKLPIGIQTFAKMREADYYYVDKTAFALKMIEEGTAYFLSRPRRFGKSLFLDTLAELFAGNEPLFRGLYCHNKWDWKVKYPVIRISFAEGVMESRAGLDARIGNILAENERRLGVASGEGGIPDRFIALIQAAAARFGQRAVILVDEYDKPILD